MHKNGIGSQTAAGLRGAPVFEPVIVGASEHVGRPTVTQHRSQAENTGGTVTGGCREM